MPGVTAQAASAGGERNPPAQREVSLPPVTVSYTGSLADLTAVEGKIDADALERELLVRRMERELVELERIRLEEEAERARKAEEARMQRTQPIEAVPRAVPTPVPQPAPASKPRSGAVLRLPDLPPVQTDRLTRGAR